MFRLVGNPTYDRLDAGYKHAKYFFPSTLFSEEINKGTFIHIYQYRKELAKDPERKQVIKTLALPLPANMSDTTSADYDTESILAMSLLTEIDTSNGIISKTFYDSIVKAGTQTAHIVARKAFDDYWKATGNPQVTNPRNISRFRDVPFKSHSFEWTMIAKNEQDSRNINRIVNNLRYHMLPDVADSTTFLHPDLFVVEFFPELIRDNTYKPNPSALTSLTVTYNGSSTPVFFKDTLEPVEVVLSIQLQEMEIETKQSVGAKYSVGKDS